MKMKHFQSNGDAAPAFNAGSLTVTFQ